jgi:outer membrane protein assembly factor BamB
MSFKLLYFEGKIDLKYLFQKFMNHSTFEFQEDFITKIWTDILDVSPQNNDNFILSGGTSYKAIKFLDALEGENLSQHDDKFIDILLNKTFGELVFYFKNFQNQVYKESILKRYNSEDSMYVNENTKHFRVNENMFVSKNCKIPIFDFGKISSITKIKLNLLWKYDTKKCIDATALITSSGKGDQNVFIGSHSGLFVSINLNSGKSNWEFQAKDRIESSACLSKCGEFIIFGIFFILLDFVFHSTFFYFVFTRML